MAEFFQGGEGERMQKSRQKQPKAGKGREKDSFYASAARFERERAKETSG